MRYFVYAFFCLGCSAPAQMVELQNAENHARLGNNEAALRSYETAQTRCVSIQNPRRRRQTCAAAHLQYSELLVSLGRNKDALLAYRRARSALTQDSAAAAQASFHAGLVALRMGLLKEAYADLWRTVTHYPNEAFAADALKRLVRDGRERAPEALTKQLRDLRAALSPTRIGDNLLYALADLAEHEQNNPQRARHYYDELVKTHPKSGLRDDAWWHGARLSRGMGDATGAVERLEALLATREVAFGAGSYFSVWLDNAQLELGIVYRDDLKNYPKALAAFGRLGKDYPASTLLDDALFEGAVTHAQAQDRYKACRDLAKLANAYPDSKYLLHRAPTLRNSLGCAN